MEEWVTKGWEAKDICDPMARTSITPKRSRFAGEFTFPGKRRTAVSAASRVGSVAAVLMFFILGAPAGAFQQIGPTSSTNIGISLSVAPKYALRTNEVGIRANGNGAADFCMSTNGKPTDLPVHLVHYPADGLGSAMSGGSAAQLHWCAVGGWKRESIEREGKDGILIVRPE